MLCVELKSYLVTIASIHCRFIPNLAKIVNIPFQNCINLMDVNTSLTVRYLGIALKIDISAMNEI